MREVTSDRAERRHRRFRRAALLVALVAGYAAIDLSTPVARAEIPPGQIWFGLSWYGPDCVPVSLDGQRKLVCDNIPGGTGPRHYHQYTEVVPAGTRSVAVYALNGATRVDCDTWQGEDVTDSQEDYGTGFAICTFATA